MQYNGEDPKLSEFFVILIVLVVIGIAAWLYLLIIERHTMNNIFARLFCSKNHSTSDEAYNIVESIAKAKPLYKELIKQAHPDKHPNNKDVAEELTAMINNNRFNYRELLKIKDLVNDKLV